jgi:hypothetical protein
VESKHPADQSLRLVALENSIETHLSLFSIAAGKQGPERCFQENSLKLYGRGHILRILRLALIPLDGTCAAFRQTWREIFRETEALPETRAGWGNQSSV